MEGLRELRDQEFIGAGLLAQVANEKIVEMSWSQKSSDLLTNERQVRYYHKLQLMQIPRIRSGLRPVYEYVDLLRLLVIKKLQSKAFPNHIIKNLLEGKSENELEFLLNEDINVKVITNPRAVLQYNSKSEVELEQEFGERTIKMPVGASSRDNPTDDSYQEVLKKVDGTRRMPASGMSLKPQNRINIPMATRIPERIWSGYRIAEGLELQIGEYFEIPTSEVEISSLVKKIEDVLLSVSKRRA